ncbi:hypothetical protein EVAR_56042_1 [Eumeta japonica]|uniref:Uncharacterized protein n=1 Tax=Eumeta variegata TaxID=151549 RepID=A0A4C1Y7I0_EUMVA|nr:hypothetical protein EVAR_56042_1 [Eumeta japonica]
MRAMPRSKSKARFESESGVAARSVTKKERDEFETRLQSGSRFTEKSLNTGSEWNTLHSGYDEPQLPRHRRVSKVRSAPLNRPFRAAPRPPPAPRRPRRPRARRRTHVVARLLSKLPAGLSKAAVKWTQP